MLTGKFFLDSSINFGNLNLRTFYVIFLSKFRISWSHLFAVSTPRSIKLNKYNLVLTDELSGIGVLQDENGVFSLDFVHFNKSDIKNT
jgi:hypothetical protein